MKSRAPLSGTEWGHQIAKLSDFFFHVQYERKPTSSPGTAGEREKHCASSCRHHTHNYWMFSRCNWSRLSALHTPWPFPMQPLKVALLECEWSLLCWWKRKMYSRMDMRCEKNVLSDKKGCMGFNRHYERVSQQLHTRGERTPLIGTITSDIIRRYANDRDIPPDTAVSVVFWFPGNSPVSAHEGEGQW